MQAGKEGKACWMKKTYITPKHDASLAIIVR